MKMKIILFRTQPVLIVLSVFFLFLSRGSDSCAGIMIDPVIIEESGRPGETITGEYKVINSGHEAVTVRIEPIDWFRQYLDKEDTIDVKKWLSLSQKEFTLEPAQIKKIGYTVSIPEHMEEEQAAQIYFSFRGKSQSESLRTRLGVVFYLGVEGRSEIDAELTEFMFDVLPKPEKEKVYDINFRITVANKSNVHIRPYGTITIKQGEKEVIILQINPEQAIYPEKTDDITAYVKDVPLTPGSYTAAAEIHCAMYDADKVLRTSKKVVIEE